MPGKFWTQEDVESLKQTMLSGMKRGQTEKESLQSAARQLGRTLIATRFCWQRMKDEDSTLKAAFAQKPPKAKQENKDEPETAEADIGRDFINIVVSSRRITTVDAAIAHFKINMDEWEIERQKVKTSEGFLLP